MKREGALRFRAYGSSAHIAIALHGGPAAVGAAAPIAEGLSDCFRVFEPWQRGSGSKPLTVADHIADLHALMSSRCGQERPALVGHSWGATLALAYAAAYPDRAGPLVLIGCGTFDPQSRARLLETLSERTSAEIRLKLAALAAECPDPSERMQREAALTEPLYNYAPVNSVRDDRIEEPFDAVAHAQTWSDMLRLQSEGVYPAQFALIDSPVLMLHGAYDPHPGEMIRACLAPYIARFKYRQLEECGHSPWRERFARDEFFRFLREWLRRQFG